MKLYQYRADIVKVTDGDTVRAYLDQGMHSFKVESLRVAGVDAPELFSGTNREAGGAALNFVIGWVADAAVNAPDRRWPFEIETMKDKQTFGRYVAHIIRTDTGESLADALVAAGHAVVSTG